MKPTVVEDSDFLNENGNTKTSLVTRRNRTETEEDDFDWLQWEEEEVVYVVDVETENIVGGKGNVTVEVFINEQELEEKIKEQEEKKKTKRDKKKPVCRVGTPEWKAIFAMPKKGMKQRFVWEVPDFEPPEDMEIEYVVSTASEEERYGHIREGYNGNLICPWSKCKGATSRNIQRGVWQATYPFKAVNKKKTCTISQRCFGWEIDGNYTGCLEEVRRQRQAIAQRILCPSIYQAK